MIASGPLYTLAPNCEYYIATDSQTQEAIAVVEAGGEPEARQFFAALHHMLRAPPEVDIRVLNDVMQPNGIPVFRLQYFKAMQAKAEQEGRMQDMTHH